MTLPLIIVTTYLTLLLAGVVVRHQTTTALARRLAAVVSALEAAGWRPVPRHGLLKLSCAIHLTRQTEAGTWRLIAHRAVLSKAMEDWTPTLVLQLERAAETPELYPRKQGHLAPQLWQVEERALRRWTRGAAQRFGHIKASSPLATHPRLVDIAPAGASLTDAQNHALATLLQTNAEVWSLPDRVLTVWRGGEIPYDGEIVLDSIRSVGILSENG